ncbi:hypothetical protein ACFL51_01055 [Myxococcota bacterium]
MAPSSLMPRRCGGQRARNVAAWGNARPLSHPESGDTFPGRVATLFAQPGVCMSEVTLVDRELRRRRDALFLVLLALMMAAMAWAVVHTAFPEGRTGDYQTAAGTIRKVPPAKLRNQLSTGRLSDHEAEHYRRAGAIGDFDSSSEAGDGAGAP